MIALALLWHQHQPYYPDAVAGENPMPWARLHGVKDYYGMALHLLEYPEFRCTINLVPSLLAQLQAYTDGRASDHSFDLSRRPVDGLSEDDCLFLLDHFFMANTHHMIWPYPRYRELHHRRGADRNTAREALRRFQERDWRDLQVWFNLTWIHPLAFEPGGASLPAALRDTSLSEGLRALRDKGRYYSEAEKNWLLDKHLQILRQILPLHRMLADSGQVELTTTPFFHPILPLLLDKKLAREAMPQVKLPRYTGGYPDDAELHVRRAVEYHAQTFGQPPRGMWPAEGSVCQAMIPLLARHGVRWIATDEEVLGASTQGFVGRDHKGHVRNPEHLYRPYKIVEDNQELGIVFRDHALSDLIGFHYQHSDGVAAAEDFFNRLRGIDQAVKHEGPTLVSVILDGENCWEHYPGGGVAFLRALYERGSRSPDVRPVAVGEYLEQHPPRDVLPRLFAGSWINHNFAIWIGHEEDNTAWDALHQTREFLRKRAPEGEPKAVAKAWEEVYIAEGSDWFWWYGDDHSSAQDGLFDHLFRKHLQNVYLLLGETPPPELARPIKRRHQRPSHTPPRAFLDVKVNGKRTFFEWLSAGHYVSQNERGTMALSVPGPIRELYFGFSVRVLFVRVDLERGARETLADYDTLRVGFVEPAGREVLVRQPGGPAPAVEFLVRGEAETAAGVAVGIDQIAELAIPFERLGVQVDEPIQFFVELLDGGQSLERAPHEGTINLTCPSPDFEQIMWDV